MTDEYGFSPSDVTRENLDELFLTESTAAEARLYELADIAEEAAEFSIPLLSDEVGVQEVLSMLSSGIDIGSYSTCDGTEAANCAREDTCRMLSVLDRVRLTELYLARLDERSRPISESDFLGAPETGQIYGYVKNQFSDEAYDVLTEELSDPRVRYYKSFSDCASALASGEVDHVLLPLEERGGVRLPTVAELIYRYDFKINSVTPVFGFAADADIKYAEISRRFRRTVRRDGDDRYIELRIPARDGNPLSELLSAASAFGMSVYRVNTHTLDFEGDRSVYFSLVLREGRSDFVPMLTYLALFAAEFVPVGIYKNLE